MIISLIVAMGKNNVIGKNNKMMWRLPKEWQYFKETTLGHCIITGRKNFEAQGRALPGRTNIVVTRQKDYQAPGCVVVHSLQDALSYAGKKGETEVFICGGGEIYRHSLELVDRMYITYVDFEEPGDVYFPAFDESKFTKKLIKTMDESAENSMSWQAYLYERKV